MIKDLTSSCNLPWHVKNRSEMFFIDILIYHYPKVKILETDEAKDPLLLKQKHEKCYSINIYTKELILVDTVDFNSLYQGYTKKCSLSDLNRELEKIPLSEFGLVIQDIYPKSNKAYIKETIYLKGGSQATRRAVIEQIISKLDKQEIKALLMEMDDYASR